MTETEYPPYYNTILQENLHKVCDSDIKPRMPVYIDLLEGLARACVRRTRAHYQTIVTIIGDPGSGKSTLGYQLAKKIDPFFRLDPDYIVTHDQLSRKLDMHERGEASSINFFDEGSVTLNSERHNTKESVGAVMLFDTLRSYEFIHIINLPHLRSLNNRVREDHVTFLCVVGQGMPLRNYGKRGFFMLYKRMRPSVFSSGVFWQPVGWGVYKPLSKKEEAEYKRFKQESQRKIVRKYVEENKEEEEE